MTKFKKLGKNLFIGFLFFYFATMLLHVFKLEPNLETIIIFLLGLSLAIFSHARKNYITVILLVVHMSIEWFEWSQTSFSHTDTILNLVHVLMDFFFLSHELTAHIKKYRYQVLTFVSLFLISVFTFSKHFLSGNPAVDSLVEIIEPFVIGGVLGCVASHLFYHVKIFGKRKRGGCTDEH